MINCRVLEKKKAKQKEEGEGRDQEMDTQLDTRIEESKQAINSNREDQKSPSLETAQNQQPGNENFKAKKDSRKKNKKKKTKKMPKRRAMCYSNLPRVAAKEKK